MHFLCLLNSLLGPPPPHPLPPSPVLFSKPACPRIVQAGCWPFIFSLLNGLLDPLPLSCPLSLTSKLEDSAGWVLANMIPFWLLLKKVGLFRVPANEETVGLDESYHGGTAYPGHGADDFLDKSVSRHGKGDSEMNGNGLSNTDQTVGCLPARPTNPFPVATATAYTAPPSCPPPHLTVVRFCSHGPCCYAALGLRRTTNLRHFPVSRRKLSGLPSTMNSLSAQSNHIKCLQQTTETPI